MQVAYIFTTSTSSPSLKMLPLRSIRTSYASMIQRLSGTWSFSTEDSALACTCLDQILSASVCKHMFSCFAHSQAQPSSSSAASKIWKFEHLHASLINAPHLIMDPVIVKSIGLKVKHHTHVVALRPRPAATADAPLQLQLIQSCHDQED